MSARAIRLAALVALALTACDGVSATLGLEQPIRIRGGQFFEGALPEGGEDGPRVTATTLRSPIALYAAAGKSFTGRATDEAVAIAISFPTLQESGYWVVPVGGPEPQFPAELIWSASMDIAPHAAPGTHRVRVVAIDGDGRVGRARDDTLCLLPRVPDNGHTCLPNNPLPDAVVVLEWDDDSDLDMQIVPPTGRIVSPRRPATEDPPDEGEFPPGTAFINRDSLLACEPDGMRQEAVMFLARPTGRWTFHARLFDSCGRPTARFVLSVYEAQGEGGERRLVETFRQAGRFVAEYDTQTSGLGLRIVEFDFDQ
jgi:hypothetical protein